MRMRLTLSVGVTKPFSGVPGGRDDDQAVQAFVWLQLRIDGLARCAASDSVSAWRSAGTALRATASCDSITRPQWLCQVGACHGAGLDVGVHDEQVFNRCGATYFPLLDLNRSFTRPVMLR
jgi:hypothetical protein